MELKKKKRKRKKEWVLDISFTVIKHIDFVVLEHEHVQMKLLYWNHLYNLTFQCIFLCFLFLFFVM